MADEHPTVLISKTIITIREALIAAGFLLTAAGAWAYQQSDVRALGVRADKTEHAVEKIEADVRNTRDRVIELRTHQKETGRQLDRLEVLLGGAPPPRFTTP